MKNPAVVLALVLAGCGSVPWTQKPEVSQSACTAACDAHFNQCPRIFAGFPERGAIECPAGHDSCLRSCATRHTAALTTEGAPVAAAPVAPPPQSPATAATPGSPAAVRAVSSKETKLRELKHLYDEGLVTDDVYKERQKAILSEP